MGNQGGNLLSYAVELISALEVIEKTNVLQEVPNIFARLYKLLNDRHWRFYECCMIASYLMIQQHQHNLVYKVLKLVI